MVLGKFGLAAVVVAAAALGGAPAGGAARPVIVSGVSQWAALARAVAGPDATVVSLLSDPNADPHDHEATARDARTVARAALVIENGAGYDTWVAQLVAARARPPAVIDAARLAGVAVGRNPHLFYDVGVAEKVVRAVSAYLTRRGAVAGVATRARATLSRLEALRRSEAAIARSCRGVGVAATEDVAGYLLSGLGLRVVTPERLRLAVGNGVDPSVHDLALALIQLGRHPALLVDNVQTATPFTNELVSQARSHHVPVVRVTETMAGADYVAWLGRVVAQVASALRTQGCLA